MLGFPFYDFRDHCCAQSARHGRACRTFIKAKACHPRSVPMKVAKLIATAGLLFAPGAFCPTSHSEGADLGCEIKFSLSGWSVIYKQAEGSGVVTCADGSSQA